MASTPATGETDQQFIYPFDAPRSFLRDVEKNTADVGDLKVCEIQSIRQDRLVVLERITHSAKLYAATLRPDLTTPAVYLKSRTAPSLEDMDAQELAAADVRPLSKTLVFSTDDANEIPPTSKAWSCSHRGSSCSSMITISGLRAP